MKDKFYKRKLELLGTVSTPRDERLCPIARLLKWEGPAHMPVPNDGFCARTFVEFPLNAGEDGYWKETGQLLYLQEGAK